MGVGEKRGVKWRVGGSRGMEGRVGENGGEEEGWWERGGKYDRLEETDLSSWHTEEKGFTFCSLPSAKSATHA